MIYMNEPGARRAQLVNRMRSAQGHMAAITAMIEGDAPCAEILHQTLAVRGALRALSEELWRAYLRDGDCGLRAEDEATRAQAWREVQTLVCPRQSRTLRFKSRPGR